MAFGQFTKSLHIVMHQLPSSLDINSITLIDCQRMTGRLHLDERSCSTCSEMGHRFEKECFLGKRLIQLMNVDLYDTPDKKILIDAA